MRFEIESSSKGTLGASALLFQMATCPVDDSTPARPASPALDTDFKTPSNHFLTSITKRFNK
jgi:hypothetical protein